MILAEINLANMLNTEIQLTSSGTDFTEMEDKYVLTSV